MASATNCSTRPSPYISAVSICVRPSSSPPRNVSTARFSRSGSPAIIQVPCPITGTSTLVQPNGLLIMVLLRATWWWREVFEHVVHNLLEFLLIFVRFCRHCVATHSTPNQFSAVLIEEIDPQRPYGRFLPRSGRDPAEPAPEPTAPKAVIECRERGLFARGTECRHGDVAVRIHFGPTLCGELGVDSSGDPIRPEWITGFDSHP